MIKKKILIISYSYLSSDPRIFRQINALINDFQIETAGGSPCLDSSIPFYSIITSYKFSLFRKIKRAIQFFFRWYDAYYWDTEKSKIAENLHVNNYDVIIANDIYTLPLAIKISNIKTKIYFDAHEYHPREFEDNLFWKFFHKPYVTYLCKKYIKLASAFSTVCDGIAKEYESFLGIIPRVVSNAANYYNLEPTNIDRNQIKLIHHGAAIPGRKIEQMIDIMKYLSPDYLFTLMLTGKGSKYYNEIVEYAKTNHVQIIEPVPYNQIVKVLNNYDIGIYCLPPSNFNNYFALPNKFFEFIQARLALVISPNPEMANFVNNFKLGIVSRDFSPKSMADVINSISVEQIIYFKKQSHIHAMELSAEENMKKIREIVLNLVN